MSDTISEVKPLSIKQNMLWNTVGSLTNLGCQWIITVLIVRMSEDFNAAGVYSLAVSVFTMFSQIAQYRTYTIQVSDVSKENTAGEYLSFRLLTCSIALAVIMVYSAFTCRSETLIAILLFSLYKIAGLVIDVFHASDQVARRMDYIGKSLILQGLGSLVSFVLIYGVTGCLELTLLVMLLMTLLVALLFDIRKTGKIADLRIGITPVKAIHLLVSCAPVVLAGIAISSASSLPRQYLSFTCGDSALGIYTSVAAPVAVIQMGASYIYNPLMGYFSEAYADKDFNKFRRLMISAIVGILVVGVVASFGLFLLGTPLLVLVYGASIADYSYLLQPLVLCAVLTGAMWFINDLLIALRNFKATFLGSAGALVAAVLTMVWAQSAFGLNGVTISTSISCLAGLVIMVTSLYRQLSRVRTCNELGEDSGNVEDNACK